MINISTDTQFNNVIRSDNQISIIYCGRDTCRACVVFKSVMKSYIEKYNTIQYKLPVVYYEIVTSDAFIRPYIEQEDSIIGGGVPSILVYYNGVRIDRCSGHLDEEGILEFCSVSINQIINSKLESL